jgi:segregation and condensation protein B
MEANDSGLKLVRMENTYQLATKSEYAEYIKKAFDIRRRTPLSSAALEVLAVVAYNQPITKAFIEQVRGVDCSSVITTLIEKGLVEERGRLELPGKPLLYGTTKNFLRCFSLGDLSELPPLPKDNSGKEVDDLGEQLTIDE